MSERCRLADVPTAAGAAVVLGQALPWHGLPPAPMAVQNGSHLPASHAPCLPACACLPAARCLMSMACGRQTLDGSSEPSLSSAAAGRVRRRILFIYGQLRLATRDQRQRPCSPAACSAASRHPACPPACLPPRLPAAPAGYAYVGGTRSIFQGVYPRDPSALLHEMGHSLGLWHASIIPSERPLWAPCGDAPLLCSHAHHSHALVPGMSTMLLQVAWQPRQSRQQLPNEA